MSSKFLRTLGLDALYFSGANLLLRPFAQGVGAVLTMHHVRPASSQPFQPNKFLEVTPEFLERSIKWLARNAYQFVSLDDLRARLIERRFDSRFVAITFDDGYRDNKIWAQPILAKYRVPYAVFVTGEFAEGNGHLWWLALEQIVARNDRIEAGGRVIASATIREKLAAYDELKTMLLRQPSDLDERSFVRDLAARYGFDQAAANRAVCMNWDEVRELAADPLATIGAHTVSHALLAKASDTDVRAELAGGRAILERKLQGEIRHLAYPFGSVDAAGEREFRIAAELGYKTAVTTRTGVLSPDAAAQLMQLPRITISGAYQRERYLDVLVSGVAPATWNGLRRVRGRAHLPAWA